MNRMNPFHYSELSFQAFGIRTGISNLRRSHLRLGLKKTAGKILQPVNFFSRYPEYYYFNEFISEYLSSAAIPSPRVLDIGSPKLFGLYLASRLPVSLDCTDISTRNIDEYIVMWHGMKCRARGEIDFSIRDARKLETDPEQYDVVYSMSVVEHIEGDLGDRRALEEMIRVLKPGGLLVFSVPIGQTYMEQLRPLSGSDHVSDAGDRDSFFQRIYSREAIVERLLKPVEGMTTVQSSVTIVRKTGRMLDRYLALGQNARGALGWLNPMISVACNRELPASSESVPSRYGIRHSPEDIYGDFIHSCVKTVRPS